MSPLIHGLVAWLIAWTLLKDVRDRRLVVVAGVAADLDGIFILFDSGLYETYHHSFGHSLVFGVAIAIVAFVLARAHFRTGVVAILVFLAHLGADIIGSNWPVKVLYPISNFEIGSSIILNDFWIYWVINPVTAIILFGITIWILWTREVSPWEFWSEWLDRRLIGLYLYPFKHRCEVCGKRAGSLCDRCGAKTCFQHHERFLGGTCNECASLADALPSSE